MISFENGPEDTRPNMLGDEDVARITHAANRQYRMALGQEPGPVWDELGSGRQRVVVDGVNAYRTGRTHSPEDLHTSWLRSMTEQGYTLGETIDVEKKTHPNMRPYEELPIEERRKDAMFVGIVKALSFGSIDRWPTF